ncbi:MAG: hypothetical protein II429_05900 [Prevotella sp.]|nr:hypothetical protein [Prevotella sp.]
MYEITITEKGSALAVDHVFLYKKDATGMLTINNNGMEDANAPIYNLSGQKVDLNYRGVVIKNGRKYLQ